MESTKRRQELRALIEAALLVAIAFALSWIRPFTLPQGGTVTPLSMLPILVIGIRHGLKWGLLGGITYTALQMLQQFHTPPIANVQGFIAVIMLDYVLAFTVLGLSGFFKNKRYGLVIAAPLCLSLRYLSHFISGIVIWGVFAPEGQPVWLFSLIYNGSYMIPEIIVTTIVSAILCVTAPMLFEVKTA